MKETKGLAWKVTTLVLAVLLAGAIATTSVFAVSARNTQNKDKNNIARLEKEAAELEGRATNLEAQNAALTARLSTLSTSSSSSGGTTKKPPPSDEEIVNAMALEMAKKSYPDVPWSTSGTKVIGDWARVGVGAPQEYNMQGQSLYFHKVGGTWTFVTLGTGLSPADIPGCPEELITPYQG